MFSDVVQLYRASGRPNIETGMFSYEGPLTPALNEVIAACRNLPSTVGAFEDGPDVEGGRVSFIWRLSSNEHGRFYDDVDDFVRGSTQLSGGRKPSNYYLVGEDVASFELIQEDRLKRALLLADFIGNLSLLSLKRGSVEEAPQRLLFVLPAEGDRPPRTLSIETQITPICIDLPTPAMDVLRALVAPDGEQQLHIFEHRQLFRCAIASVASRRAEHSDGKSPFEFLIAYWEHVIREYEYSAECYVQKFSFEKLKKEIARTELEYSGRVAAVLGESASKLLALPLEIAGLVGIAKANSMWEAALLAVGVLTAALLVNGTIHNQLLAYHRVKAGFDLAMSDIDRADGAPASLDAAIRASKHGFNRQSLFLLRVYAAVRVAVWLPVIASVLIIVSRYSELRTDRSAQSTRSPAAQIQSPMPARQVQRTAVSGSSKDQTRPSSTLSDNQKNTGAGRKQSLVVEQPKQPERTD